MTNLGVALRENANGRAAGRYPLAAHAVERLIAQTHLGAVLSGSLPNDGAPLDEARVSLAEPGRASPALDVRVGVGDACYAKRYGRDAVADDAQALISRLASAGTLAAGLYAFELCELDAPAGPDSGLRMRPLARALPRLRELSLEAAGIERPRCAHPTIFVPAAEAERLLAHAAATPEVEVGALLVVSPFLVAEPVPHRLGVYVRRAQPLADGTRGDAVQLRVTPQAIANVPVDEARGLFRGGLAHSHPAGESADGIAHFLSPEDLDFATAFFWRPFQIQLVVDVRERTPERAFGAYCWIDGRLSRVCFRILPEIPPNWRQ